MFAKNAIHLVVMVYNRFMKKTKIQILDYGVIGGEKQLYSVVDLLSNQTNKAVVVDKADIISHWWLIQEIESKRKVMYFGTPDTFSEYCGFSKV